MAAGCRRRWAAVPAVALALAAPGCSRGGADRPSSEPSETPVAVRIALHPQIRLDHAASDLEDRVAAAAVRWIRGQGGARLPVAPENPLGVTIRVDLSEDASRLVIDESLKLRHAGKWPLEVVRSHRVSIPPGGVDLAAALGTGVEAALVLLDGMAALFDLDDDRLTAVVGRTEAPVDLRVLAVRILQDRGARGAVDDLLAVFPDAPEPLRLTVIDALGTLSGGGDVARLLAKVDGRKVDEISRVLQTIAMVGGQDAREFAAWMAVAHPDERVQEMAREACAQIGDLGPQRDTPPRRGALP